MPIILKNQGFTMIELLIAVIIFSIGLIGIASMQATSLQLTRDAHVTASASSLAEEILERIRLNPLGQDTESYNNITGTQTAPSCITSTTSDGTSVTDPNSTSDCTPAQLAELDAYLWTQKVATQLPAGQGSVKYENDIFTVTVKWQEIENNAVVEQEYIVGSHL